MSTALRYSNATFIGSVAGKSLYENPEYGDETPLLMKIGSDLYIETDMWELPSREEMLDWLADPLYGRG